MTMADRSNAELGRLLDDIRTQLQHGFEGLNDRVDDLTTQVRTTNGRVGTLERVTDVQTQKITNLDREVFSPMKRPVTRGDVYLVGSVLGVVALLVRWLPALMTAAKEAP